MAAPTSHTKRTRRQQQPAPAPVALFRPTLPASRRILDDMYAQLAAAVGLEDGESDGRTQKRLTVDLLRALDAGEHVPAWLATANTMAIVELVRWHDERGLLGPEVEEDPGEPTEADRTAEPLARPVAETPERQLIEWLKCRRSVVYFIDSYCHLEDKERGVIPFRLWRWQAWVLYRWHANAKNMLLKARQIGASELAAAYALWLMRFHATKRVLFLSKGQEEAEVLLGRAVTMLNHLPLWLHPASGETPDAVEIGKANTSTLEFVHHDSHGLPHPSNIKSLPATQATGRSRTVSLVVLDEWAYMIWAEQIWASVRSTADGGGKIIGLSTANGVGNLFHRMWLAAVRRENGFWCAFLSWRRHPRHDDAWYAEQQSEYEAIDDLPRLHQENPSEPTQAFIQSGNTVFSAELITLVGARIDDEERAGFVPAVPLEDGLVLYELPAPGMHYIIAADQAIGSQRGDYDAATVICRETAREVALLHGRWPVEEFAMRLDRLGCMYHDALLAPERNNEAFGVLLALSSGLAHEAWTGERTPYANLYHHDEPLVDGRRPEARPGFPTTITTKPLMIDTFKRVLREGSYHMRSRRALEEAQIFAYVEGTSKTSAPSGFHDDILLSQMIAVYILSRPDPANAMLDYLRQMQQHVAGRVLQAEQHHRTVGITPEQVLLAERRGP